ncbi:MAG TPA: DUF3710 domain-containing protein [Trebonia sp.]|nr:DUF3710 domain-containing protein [Trebonia sp.]
MFGRRRSAGDRDRDLGSQVVDEVTEAGETASGSVLAGETAQAGVTGPWDVAEPHQELPRVDLGSLQVPVLEGTDIQLVFAEQHGAWVTVRHQLSELQLQAFAAPKRSGLWDEVRGEIGAEINGAGGQSVERQGPFGTELLAHVPAEPGQPASGLRAVRFTGVDGPRWFLRGLFAGAAADDPQAAAPLEAVFREVVVVRGEGPIPPRDMLELRLPPEAAAAMEEQARVQQEQEQEQAQQQGQNRFSTAPNPFQRGPEMTETRLAPTPAGRRTVTPVDLYGG